MRALATIVDTIGARWRLWLLTGIGFFLAYYGVLISVLVLRFGHWPNYVTFYDYPAAIARIIRATPSLTDIISIARDEWLFEAGYINYDYGHGIAEWSLAVLPTKALAIAFLGALISTDLLLLRRIRNTCPAAGRSLALGGAGFGAILLGLANISLTWIVCCAAPTWVVGLTMLGLGTATAFWMEPFGGWLTLLGALLLMGTTLWLARRVPLADRIRPGERAVTIEEAA